MINIHVEKALFSFGWAWAIFNGDKLIEAHPSKKPLIHGWNIPKHVRERVKELKVGGL